jgi:hypothetical protein
MIGLRLPRTKRDWVAVVAGAAFAIGSGVALVRGCMSLMWPKTDGTITYSTAKNTRRTYTIDIRYRYSAGGQPHYGDRYRFQFVMTRDRMRSRDVDLVQARYPVGERVMVAVNPGDVSDAVLLPGPDFEGILWLGFGMLLMFGGLGESRPRNEAAVVTISPGRVGPRYRTAKVLAVIGAAVFLYGARDLYEGWNSLRWPSADGRILYSHARTSGSYATVLWYEYYVTNRRYVAGNYRTGGNATPFRDVAVAAARRYPVGREIKVYYNPSQPAEALLETGVWYGNFVLPGIGVAVLAAALLAKKYAEAIARREQN